MKVFVAFSGNLSEQVAIVFGEWLPNVIPSVKTFVSSRSIWKGSRWHNELAKQLATTNCGILCLTSTNCDSPWINFEGGALSKFDGSAVFPFLLDLPVSALGGKPLAQFQSAECDRANILAMVKRINRLQKPTARLSPERLKHNFGRCWPRLNARLDDIRKQSHATGESPEPGDLQNVRANKIGVSEHAGESITNSARASACGETSALREPTVHPRRRGVSSLRPPISKRWDETVRPKIPGVSSLRRPMINRWMPQISDSLPLSGRRQMMSGSSEGRTTQSRSRMLTKDPT